MALMVVTLVLTIIAVIAVAAYMLAYRKIANSYLRDTHVQRKSRVLTPSERAFFEQLVRALSDDYYIFAKMSLSDVVEVSPKTNWLQKSSIQKCLGNTRLDYILCQKRDLSIFGVVELENFDNKVAKKDRREREKLVSRICQLSNIRLFYFDARQDYQDMDIHQVITGRPSKGRFEQSPTHQSQLTIDRSVNNSAVSRPCPKCDGELAIKVAVKGKQMGKKFLMCRKYPYCDYQLPVTDAQSDKAVTNSATKKEAQN